MAFLKSNGIKLTENDINNRLRKLRNISEANDEGVTLKQALEAHGISSSAYDSWTRRYYRCEVCNHYFEHREERVFHQQKNANCSRIFYEMNSDL